jgi:hypothetical protein
MVQYNREDADPGFSVRVIEQVCILKTRDFSLKRNEDGTGPVVFRANNGFEIKIASLEGYKKPRPILEDVMDGFFNGMVNFMAHWRSTKRGWDKGLRDTDVRDHGDMYWDGIEMILEEYGKELLVEPKNSIIPKYLLFFILYQRGSLAKVERFERSMVQTLSCWRNDPLFQLYRVMEVIQLQMERESLRRLPRELLKECVRTLV